MYTRRGLWKHIRIVCMWERWNLIRIVGIRLKLRLGRLFLTFEHILEWIKLGWTRCFCLNWEDSLRQHLLTMWVWELLRGRQPTPFRLYLVAFNIWRSLICLRKLNQFLVRTVLCSASPLASHTTLFRVTLYLKPWNFYVIQVQIRKL